MNLIAKARRRAGMTQVELARASGTSHQTIHQYETGKKSPTLATASRIIEACGMKLSLESNISWQAHSDKGRPFHVPDRLPGPSIQPPGPVELPLHLAWSRNQQWDTSDPRQRARVYEIVLREGRPVDIEQYVDGELLRQAWSDMTLPRVISNAWKPIVEESRAA